jgi:excisionase family DNA binding protein
MSEFLLTVGELARQARLNEWTVRRYIREGQIQAKIIGGKYCIRASEAERFLGFRPEKPEPQKVAS